MTIFSKLTNSWFFSDIPWFIKPFGIYVKGDALILIPLLVLISITSLFSLKIGLITLGLYISIRHLGEMIYWLLQQFGSHAYRPADFRLKKLNNEAIYILYQLLSLCGAVIGFTFLIGVILYVK